MAHSDLTIPFNLRPARHGYLFGQNIARSLSPFLHQVVYDQLGLPWKQLRLDSADMSQFLQLVRHDLFYGASVTMPNKVAILPYLDELTDECRDVGACNTLFTKMRNGQRILCGTNTDVIGIRNALQGNVSDPSFTFQNRPALVIGGGGAARSAIYALRRWLKVTQIYLVNRDKSEAESMIADCSSRGYGHDLLHVASMNEACAAPGPGAVVACIPDREPETPGEILARQLTEVFLKKAGKGVMLEMCYNPTPFTRLVAMAQRLGWQVILGTEAMIWQGLEQDRLWTGLETAQLPVAEVQEAIAGQVVQRGPSRL